MLLRHFWLEIAGQHLARRECCVFRACYSAASPAEWNTQRLHRSAIMQDHRSKWLWIRPVAPSFSGKPLLKLIHAHTSLARTGYTFPQQAGFSKPSTVVAKILCFFCMRVGSSLAKRLSMSKVERRQSLNVVEHHPQMVRAGLQLFHPMNMNVQPQDFSCCPIATLPRT